MITRARASAFLFGGAALSSTRLAGFAQTMPTVRIGIVPIESAAEPYYAQDMGFFAKAGFEVDIQVLQGPPQIAAAMSSSTLDIGYSPVDSLAIFHRNNIPVAAIAPAIENVYPTTAHTAALILPANSTVQNARDLGGKTVAVASLHTFSELAARAWIDKNNGDSTAVKFVEIPFPAMPAALGIGRIDGAWVTEPFIAAATKNGRVLGYGFEGIARHFILGTWFTMLPWAQSHADLVSRFAAVMHDTAIWANKNPRMTGEILAKYTKIDPAVIATMARVHYAEQFTPALMQPVIDVAAKYDGFGAFPARELVYPQSH